MAEVKLVIDGEEVILEPAGKSRKGTYEKYKEPDEYKGQGDRRGTSHIVTVYRKPGWMPSQGK